MRSQKICGTSVLLSVAAALSMGLTLRQPPSLPKFSTEQPRVFLFVQRTDAHGKYSKSEVFHDAMDYLLAYLNEKKVAIAVDEFGGRNFAESATPMETVFKIARDAKASSVLYVIVDRPKTKWIKITAQCYDISERLLWSEEASNSSSMSGGDALMHTKKKLREKLEPHAGKEGLPVIGEMEPAANKK